MKNLRCRLRSYVNDRYVKHSAPVTLDSTGTSPASDVGNQHHVHVGGDHLGQRVTPPRLAESRGRRGTTAWIIALASPGRVLTTTQSPTGRLSMRSTLTARGSLPEPRLQLAVRASHDVS